MTRTQKPEALRLVDKYEVHGFLGDHRFAKDEWCRQAATELLSQHARIAELEAQLSAIGAPDNWRDQFSELVYEDLSAADNQDVPLEEYPARILNVLDAIVGPAHLAEGATAQIETLRAELAEETEAAENWRRLALQFDHHRLQALGHLKAILHPDSSVDEYKTAELFLKAPPLDGEEVLAQRIAELAAAPEAAQGLVERDEAFEAVRKVFCKLQRYSFFLDSRGNVRRCADHCGNWVEFEAVHTLFEPQSVDAAIAAQAKKGEK